MSFVALFLRSYEPSLLVTIILTSELCCWPSSYFDEIGRYSCCTDKKHYKIFLIYNEIQMGADEESYMMKGFLIYEEVRKYLVIYEEAVRHT
jgi:hypothetical protein